MPSPFVPGCYKKPTLTKRNPTDYLLSRKIVLKTVITGYEDKEMTKPIGSLVPQVEEEKTPIKELVQSHASEVGVVNIINRILKTGDISLLNQREAQYVDTTTLPRSIAEVQAKAIALESIYASIPDDLKKDMTLSEFVKSMTNEKIKAFYDSQSKAQEDNPEQKGE